MFSVWIGIVALRREVNERRIPSSTEHEIAVLLEYPVLASVTPVRDRIREMLGTIDLNDDSRISAEEIDFHSAEAIERDR